MRNKKMENKNQKQTHAADKAVAGVDPYLPLLIIQEFVLKNKQYQQTFIPEVLLCSYFYSTVQPPHTDEDEDIRQRYSNTIPKSSHSGFSRGKGSDSALAKEQLAQLPQLLAQPPLSQVGLNMSSTWLGSTRFFCSLLSPKNTLHTP